MAGIIEVKDQGKVRIYDADNSNYIDIVVPSTVSSNRTITIPDASFTIPTAGGSTGIDDNADATAMTIDSNENIGIGVTDPGSYSAKELVVGKTGSEAGMTIRSGSSNTANLYFADGTSVAERYQGYVQYDHANSKMNLGTAATTQWSLDSSGNFLPAATDHGIYLGVTSAAAGNLLNDYEEGTFTPTWTSNVTVSVASGNYGYYTKIGNVVTVHFGAVLNSSGGTPNYFSITNAPFQSNLASGTAVGSAREYGQTGHQHMATIGDNSTTVQVKKYDSTAVANPYLACTLTYRTD